MKAEDYKISSELFVLHSKGEQLHDKKLETKPVSFMKDAFYRFCRNKASIVAGIIIALLFLFSMLGTLVTPYTVAYEDIAYAYAAPKSHICTSLGLPFWNGSRAVKEVTEATYLTYSTIQEEIGRPVIISDVDSKEIEYMGKTNTYYSFRVDTYETVGARYVLLTEPQYKELQAYQDEFNRQVILPITDPDLRPTAEQDKKNANIWYKTKKGKGNKTEIVYDKDGKLVNIYAANDGTDLYTSKMLWEGDTKLYNYAEHKDGGMLNIRVDYKEYYRYIHHVAGDGIEEPSFLFGANNAGKDLFTCLASGARFSFLLAIIVSAVNLFVGAIYGAVEGYYGGKTDIIMERIVELLGSIPFMIVITLLKYYLNVSHVLILFIAFFLTGWTGMAARTRMQFYRFKNQEYVYVAKTLGANDRRVMFKHIFPNAIGTLITGSVLTIPGVIFSETSLSYLNIINLSTGNMTSVGTLLSTGQNYLFTYPHLIVAPAIFISLLMLSFNLFGNGLRDAFNPSLRGTE